MTIRDIWNAFAEMRSAIGTISIVDWPLWYFGAWAAAILVGMLLFFSVLMAILLVFDDLRRSWPGWYALGRGFAALRQHITTSRSKD